MDIVISPAPARIIIKPDPVVRESTTESGLYVRKNNDFHLIFTGEVVAVGEDIDPRVCKVGDRVISNKEGHAELRVPRGDIIEIVDHYVSVLESAIIGVLTDGA